MTGAGMSTSAYALGLACKSMSACRCLKQKSFSNKRTRQNLGKIFLLLVSTTSTVTLIGSLAWMFLQKIGHKISSQRSKLHQKGLVDEVVSGPDGEGAKSFPQGKVSAISFFHPLSFSGGGPMATCPFWDTTRFSKGANRAKSTLHKQVGWQHCARWLLEWHFWNLTTFENQMSLKSLGDVVGTTSWGVLGASCPFLAQPVLFCTLQPHSSSSFPRARCS